MIAYQAMKLIVYADESGTHDWTGQSKGSMVPVICGYIDKLENWAAFCLDWKTTLNKYKAPFFHFSETPKSLRAKPNNPYHGWDNETVDDFIHELALIASVSAIPIGGQCNARIFNEVVTGSHPFKRMFEEFFNDFIEAMKAQWPNHDEPIIFVFDDSNDPNWKAMLLEVFNAYREKDSRLSAIYFVSGKKYPYYPLQAADMLSYLTRQVAEKYFAEMEQAAPKLQSRRILDLIMNRNMRPIGHIHNYSVIPHFVFRQMVALFRKDEKEKKAEWRAQGITNRIYYPHEDFPFEKLKVPGSTLLPDR